MSTTEELMPSSAIERALDAVRQRITEMQRQIVDLSERVAADQEEEQLLARLLAVRRGEPLQQRAFSSTGPITRESQGSPKTNSPVPAVIEELTSAGRPLHISDLMRLLTLRKVSIPGAGTQANLITYLRRDPRFVRASRGMYALAEWGIDAMPPTRRRKRRKRGKARATQ